MAAQALVTAKAIQRAMAAGARLPGAGLHVAAGKADGLI